MNESSSNTAVGKHDSTLYSLLFIANSIKKGAILGMYVDANLFITLVASTIIGSVSGLAHGFFRAATRKPLDGKAQIVLQDNLKTFIENQNVNRQALIDHIKNNYKDSALTSNASNVLMSTLNSSQASLDTQLKAIQSYVTEPLSKDSTFLKNNGKALFLVIADFFNKLNPCVSQDLPHQNT